MTVADEMSVRFAIDYAKGLIAGLGLRPANACVLAARYFGIRDVRPIRASLPLRASHPWLHGSLLRPTSRPSRQIAPKGG